jgi:hypothetical protein
VNLLAATITLFVNARFYESIPICILCSLSFLFPPADPKLIGILGKSMTSM